LSINKIDEAKYHIDQVCAGGKGHPIFIDAQRSFESPYFDLLAKKLGRSNPLNLSASSELVAWIKGQSYSEAIRKFSDFEGDILPMQHCLINPDGSTLIKALTCKESIEAIVNHYNSQTKKRDRLKFLKRGFDSCSAAVFKKGTNEFKILSFSSELINYFSEGDEKIISVNFNDFNKKVLSIQNGKYNVPLNKAEVMENEAWLALCEWDKFLLKEFRDIVFAESDLTEAMPFCIPEQNDKGDFLYPIFVNSISNLSKALATTLDVPCSFLKLE